MVKAGINGKHHGDHEVWVAVWQFFVKGIYDDETDSLVTY